MWVSRLVWVIRRGMGGGWLDLGGQGEIDPGAFFQLRGDGPLVFLRKGCGAAAEEAAKLVVVDGSYGTFARSFDPPTGKHEHRDHGDRTAVQSR